MYMLIGILYLFVSFGSATSLNHPGLNFLTNPEGLKEITDSVNQPSKTVSNFLQPCQAIKENFGFNPESFVQAEEQSMKMIAPINDSVNQIYESLEKTSLGFFQIMTMGGVVRSQKNLNMEVKKISLETFGNSQDSSVLNLSLSKAVDFYLSNSRDAYELDNVLEAVLETNGIETFAKLIRLKLKEHSAKLECCQIILEKQFYNIKEGIIVAIKSISPKISKFATQDSNVSGLTSLVEHLKALPELNEQEISFINKIEKLQLAKSKNIEQTKEIREKLAKLEKQFLKMSSQGSIIKIGFNYRDDQIVSGVKNFFTGLFN